LNFKEIGAILILINVVLMTPTFAFEVTSITDQNTQVGDSGQFKNGLSTSEKTNKTTNTTNKTNSTVFNTTNSTNSTMFNTTNSTNSTTFNDTNGTNATSSFNDKIADGIVIGVCVAVEVVSVATLIIGIAAAAPTAIAIGICSTTLFTPYAVGGVVAAVLDLCDVVDIWEWL